MTPDRFPTAADHPDREVLTWADFGHAVRALARTIAATGWEPDLVVAVARGGLVPAGALAYALDRKAMGTLNVEFYSGVGETLADPVVLPPALDTSELRGQRVLVVDDVADSGRTLQLVLEMIGAHGADVRSAVLYTKPRSVVRPTYSWRETDAWIMFPWSSLPPVTGRGAPDA
ncbi:MAG TPA: phosphoribosyltransferase [Micrococcales bacterium]|uniref:Phosphoribosyltransferase n=1 Tax=Miniimonas arenae TaxID=676201 RepID=A0A5C5BBH4_9MICO|nr:MULTISPECIES: phosphoribosyltransferase [Miniimonas]TNU73886.1 phosphoribosyltransferase [Miniimonas arenae]HCX85254.1 phosphoribosyltransferase [Micrococcales bacterium]